MVTISKSNSRKKTKQTKSIFISKFNHNLKWFTPHFYLPHGLSGAMVFFIGFFFLLQAFYFGPNYDIFGYDIHGPRPRFLLHIFLGAAFCNALGGIRMVKKAPAKFHIPFLLGAMCQISYVWFAYRFSSEATRRQMNNNANHNNTFGFDGSLSGDWRSYLDTFFVCLTLLFLISTPILVLFSGQIVFVIPIFISTFALSLTFFYPLQLALFGPDWFGCVIDTYPYQIAGFTNYIYIPTIYSFSIIFFGLTLMIRKIISGRIFASTFLCLNLLILFVTVLTQEVHITNVSTQKLILPCSDEFYSEEDSVFVKILSEWLDTSTFAKEILFYFGIPLNPPPTY